MNQEVITSKFAIYFHYICGTDPKYSDNPKDKYIDAYIVELSYDDKQNIINVFDIDGNNIDLNDVKNIDLVKKIKIFGFCYKSYDIAKHNLIYEIYFGEPNPHENIKYNINIYKTIREKYPYTGDSYYYDKEGNILRKCFHINGSIEGKFYGYYFNTYYLHYEIDYINGKIHGKYIKYHSNGKVKNELNYDNGKIIGKTCSYHYNGSIETECTYIDGKIEGEKILYGIKYDDIIVIKIFTFVNGKENGKSYTYDYNCSQDTYTLISDCDYVNGKKNGIENIYENNKIVRTITYKNNKKNGLSTYMGKTKYGNGYYIHIEKTYKDGKRNGINKYYNDLGQIKMTKEYKNDCCYNETYYYSTGVKKESIDITYDDTPIYGDGHPCTKEFNVIKNYNESGELIDTKNKTTIIEHDGYEYCNDSDYYDEDRIYRDTYNGIDGDDRDDRDDEKLCTYEYLHFVNI